MVLIEIGSEKIKIQMADDLFNDLLALVDGPKVQEDRSDTDQPSGFLLLQTFLSFASSS